MNAKRLPAVLLVMLVAFVSGCKKKGGLPESDTTLSEAEAGKLLDDLYNSDPAVRRHAAESLAQPGLKMPHHFNFGPKLIGYLTMRNTDASTLAMQGGQRVLPVDDQYGVVYVHRAAANLLHYNGTGDAAAAAADRLASALGTGELDGEPARLACEDMGAFVERMAQGGISESSRKQLLRDLNGSVSDRYRLHPSAETAKRIEAVRRKIEALPSNAKAALPTEGSAQL